jgi:hypothetical protein
MEWHSIGPDSALLLKLYSVLLYSFIFRLCVSAIVTRVSIVYEFFNAVDFLFGQPHTSSPVSVFRHCTSFSYSIFIFSITENHHHICRSSSYNPLRCISYCFLHISPVSNLENNRTQMSIRTNSHHSSS